MRHKVSRDTFDWQRLRCVSTFLTLKATVYRSYMYKISAEFCCSSEDSIQRSCECTNLV